MIWIREILRSKLKFGLLAAAIGLLFFLLVFVNTLSTSLLDNFVGAIESNTADVLVFDSEAQATIPASRLDASAVEAIAGVEGVVTASPISELSTDAEVRGEATDISLWGVDVGGPGSPGTLIEGRLPGAGEAVVDASARDAGLVPGSYFSVGGVSLEVVGVADRATYSVLPTAYADNSTWAKVFRGLYPGATEVPINLVGVEVAAGRGATEIASAISALPGLEGLVPAAAASATPGVSSIQQSFGLISGITFVIVIVVVGFFFQILTVQKLKVFALLKAVGSKALSLSGYVLGQIGLLVATGVLVGSGLLIVTALATRETFAVGVDPILLGTSGGAILGASLLSGGTSIRRILRQDPAGAALGGSS